MKKYKVIISADLNKILPIISTLTKNVKITRHHINSNEFWHVELENEDHFVCTPPEKLKNMNIQIDDLWIDKNIPQETINRLIANKYIGKKENIIWI